MPTELVTEVTVLPDGMHEDDINLSSWSLTVKWRGPYNGRHGGGYSVSHHGRELSRASNWGYPQRFQRWQYRFETLEQALESARAVVNDLTSMGRTFAEFGPRRASEVLRRDAGSTT